MSDAGAPAEAAVDLIVSLFVEVSPFELESARESARIRSTVPKAGLSLGERACLAFARARALPVISADRRWLESSAPLGLDIRSIC